MLKSQLWNISSQSNKLEQSLLMKQESETEGAKVIYLDNVLKNNYLRF